MSVIVNYLIVCEHPEREAVREMNLALHIADEERRQTFNEISMKAAGGSRYYESDVYAAAFNHLVPHTIDEAIVAASWHYPDRVHVVVSSGDYDIDQNARTVTQMRAELGGGGA